jgi:hypothetical protein
MSGFDQASICYTICPAERRNVPRATPATGLLQPIFMCEGADANRPAALDGTGPM